MYSIFLKLYNAQKQKFEYVVVRPSHGSPYQFKTEQEARHMSEICYPEHQELIKIKESDWAGQVA